MSYIAFNFIMSILAGTIGVIGVAIIIIGVVSAVAEYMRGMAMPHNEGEDLTEHHIDPVRVDLGRYINFGLEFIIAKDLIEIMFDPSWSEIGQFFMLVLIRTLISFFLIYEINKIETKRKG